MIDDGSDENLAQRYQNCADQFGAKYIRKQNGGVSSARNLGMDHACGEFITFIDSDDYLLSDDTILDHIHTDIWHSYDVIIYDEVFKKGKKENVIHFADSESAVQSTESLISDMLVKSKLGFVHGIVYSRDFIKRNKLNFDENCIQREDAEFNLSVILNEPSVRYISEAIYEYEYRAGNAIKRWKANPEQMFRLGIARYQRNKELAIAYVDKGTVEKLRDKRIQSLYENAVDLYSAGRMNNEYKSKLQSQMKELLNEEPGRKPDEKAKALLEGKWFQIRLYAIARVAYLKLTGLY